MAAAAEVLTIQQTFRRPTEYIPSTTNDRSAILHGTTPTEFISPDEVDYVVREQTPLVEQRLEQNPIYRFIQQADREDLQKQAKEPWYDLSRVGFNIDGQIHLLNDALKQTQALWLENKGLDTSKKNIIERWANQTEKDLLHYGREYLSDENVYSCSYIEKEAPDGSIHLFNTEYDKFMLDTITKQERSGSVFRAHEELDTHFTQNNEGLGVLVSPLGPTGIIPKPGAQEIVYEDSYLFLYEKKHDPVKGTYIQEITIKTDFSIRECIEAVKRLTGKQLPQNSPLSAFADAIALYTPKDAGAPQTMQDVIDIVRQVRKDLKEKPDGPLPGKTWTHVSTEIARAKDHLRFQENVHETVDDFKRYIMSSNLSANDMKKGIAATLYMLTHILRKTNTKTDYVVGTKGSSGVLYTMREYDLDDLKRTMQDLPGCAGGGGKKNALEAGMGTVLEAIANLYGGLGMKGVEIKTWNFKKKEDGKGCSRCGREVECGPCGYCDQCGQTLAMSSALEI